MSSGIKAFALVFAFMVCLTSNFANADYAARLGGGSTFSPQAFLLSADFEYRPEPHFAIGPGLFWALGNNSDYTIPYGSGRIILPKEFWNGGREDKGGLELYLLAGAGYSFRETSGTRVNAFSFVSGAGVDFFLTRNFFAGVLGNLIWNAEPVEQSLTSFRASVGYRF